MNQQLMRLLNKILNIYGVFVYPIYNKKLQNKNLKNIYYLLFFVKNVFNGMIPGFFENNHDIPEHLKISKSNLLGRGKRIKGLIIFSLSAAMFFYIFHPVFLTVCGPILMDVFQSNIMIGDLYEILGPIQLLMFIILVAMISIPALLVFRENYVDNHLNQPNKSSVEKIMPHDSCRDKSLKLPKEGLKSTIEAPIITCYFDQASNINALSINGTMVPIETTRARRDK